MLTEDGENSEDDGVAVETVEMWDMYAIALYYDGTYGPETGIIRVNDIVSNQSRSIEYWHGHRGVNHGYTLTPEHYQKLKSGERIIIETTDVDNHAHTLFIDPTDEQYRVEGSEIIEVEI